MKLFKKLAAGMTALGIMLTVFPITAHASETVTLPINVYYHQSDARQALDLVNAFRTDADAWKYDSNNVKQPVTGLKTLTWDYELEKIAMQRAAEIAVRTAHTRPDDTAWSTAYTDEFSSYNGENIAWGWTGVTEAMNAWREDDAYYDGQAHRRNMLSENYTCFAEACVEVNGMRYWVQEFGNRTSGTTAYSDPVDGTRTVNVNLLSSYITDMTCINGAISITSEDPSIAVPELDLKVTLTAPDVDGNGNTNEFISPVTDASWSSNDSSIVSVGNGTLNLQGNGITSVNASAYGRTFTIQVIAGGKPMYRMYNPNSGEHFYTAEAAERDGIVRVGWVYEGVGWIAPESGDPVFRMYNANGGEHHYTLSRSEAEMLVNAGWELESDCAWYSAPASTGVPLYRQYNPNQYSCNHNYTKSQEENDWLVSLGWEYEGVSWYAIG